MVQKTRFRIRLSQSNVISTVLDVLSACVCVCVCAVQDAFTYFAQRNFLFHHETYYLSQKYSILLVTTKEQETLQLQYRLTY